MRFPKTALVAIEIRDVNGVPITRLEVPNLVLTGGVTLRRADHLVKLDADHPGEVLQVAIKVRP